MHGLLSRESASALHVVCEGGVQTLTVVPSRDCTLFKVPTNGALQVPAIRRDNAPLGLELKLERVTVDGEPAVRVIVPVDRPAEAPPEELVEQALWKDPSTGFLVRHHFLGGALHQQLAIVQDIGAVDNLECLTHIVVGNQHADAAVLQVGDEVADFPHRDRVDTGKRFV